MKGSRIEKLEEPVLARLEPRERVKMILEAGARRDRQAAERLAAACPRGTYRTPAAEFLDELDLARALANAGVSIWAQARHALQVVETFQAGAGKRTARAALLREQREFILGGFRSAWAGFNAFCRESLDLPGLTVVAGFPLKDNYALPAEELGSLEKMTREGEADKETAAYWLETLRAEVGPGGGEQ